MKMKYVLLFMLAASMILTSCTSERAPKTGTFRRNAEVFPKLRDYSLELSLLSSRREFYAGDESVILTFSLKNTGVRPVTIFEWHTYELANLNLYCRPGTADQKTPPDAWKLSSAYDPAAVNMKSRSPLTLNPGNNKALIQVPAAFLRGIRNPSGKKMPYTIRAELNLKSVTVASEPVEIWIK